MSEAPTEDVVLALNPAEYAVLTQVTALGMAVMTGQKATAQRLAELLGSQQVLGEIARVAFAKMSNQLLEEGDASHQ